MKKSLIVLLIMSSNLFLQSSFAQKKVTPILKKVPEARIKESILAFANLLDTQQFKKFGIKDQAQLKSLKPGIQFQNYFIGTNDIKNFKPTDDYKKIIREFPSVEVALVDESGKILTAIEFDKKVEKWNVIGYGATPEMISVSKAQDVLGKNTLQKAQLIRIPALFISFLAVPTSSGICFIPLADNTYAKFKKGEKLKPSEAITRLMPLANQLKGFPKK
jgi:hypothetical protein